jgi:hypothetical protein
MALTLKNQLLISFKRAAGKAHTSALFGQENETIGSLSQLGTDKIFASTIASPEYDITDTGQLYQTGSSGATQFIRFELTPIATGQYAVSSLGSVSGTTIDDNAAFTSDSTFHAYALKISGSYQTRTAALGITALAGGTPGTLPYADGYTLTGSTADPLGSVQLIPTTFGSGYQAVLRNATGTSISPLNPIEWYLDYFNGVLFVQENALQVEGGSVPVFVDAYMYTGKYLDTKLTEIEASIGTGGGGGSGVGWSKSGTVLFTSESYSQVQITGSLLVSGSNSNLNVLGNITGSAISASAGFIGDGRQLTNVTASFVAPGTVTILRNGSTAIEALTDKLFASSSLVVSGSGIAFAVSGTVDMQYASFTSSLLPKDNQVQNLGSVAKQWDRAWIRSGSFTDLSVSTISGNTATFSTVNVTTLNQTTTTNLNVSQSFITLSSGSNSLQLSNGLLVQKSTTSTGIADGLIYAEPENTGIYGTANRWAFSSSISLGSAQTSRARNIVPFMQIQTAAFTGNESPVLGKGDFMMVSGSGATDGLYIYF